MPSFADNLKTLPGIETLAALVLRGPDGVEVARIENRPGSQGSLAVYSHLAQVHGSIDNSAAQAGLLLYAKHTEDARLNPGKHPNIDRLLAISQGGCPLMVQVLPKAE